MGVDWEQTEISYATFPWSRILVSDLKLEKKLGLRGAVGTIIFI